MFEGTVGLPTGTSYQFKQGLSPKVSMGFIKAPETDVNPAEETKRLKESLEKLRKRNASLNEKLCGFADRRSEIEFLVDYFSMMRAIRPQIHNPFGLGPLAAFILARDNEIKTVRMILAGKRNKLSADMIRERVRETYV